MRTLDSIPTTTVKFPVPFVMVDRYGRINDIVATLVRHLFVGGFSVPDGWTATFEEEGHGPTTFVHLARLSGPGFSLGMTANTDRGGVVTRATVGKISVGYNSFGNGGVTDAVVYVGREWEKDKDDFIRCPKLHKEALVYEENGIAMEYVGKRDLTPFENGILNIQAEDRVACGLTEILEAELGAGFMETPWDGGEIEIRPEHPVPVPECAMTLFCTLRGSDLSRLSRFMKMERTGKEYDEEGFPLVLHEDRYGISSGGERLVRIGDGSGMEVHPIHHDGFAYLFRSLAEAEALPARTDTAGMYPGDIHVAKINLDRANHVFVVDWSVGDGLPASQTTMARTMIPLARYDGSFLQPVFLSHRDLDLNEITEITEYLP